MSDILNLDLNNESQKIDVNPNVSTSIGAIDFLSDKNSDNLSE